MKLKTNSEKILNIHLNKDNFVSTKKALEANLKYNHKQKFFQELQIYITKLGIAISDCSLDYHITRNTYLGAIDFLCKKVVGKTQLHSVMKAININNAGNIMKHEIEDIKGDIDYTVKQYNQLISELIFATKLNSLKQCYLSKKENIRDVAFIEEQKHHKYFAIHDKRKNKAIKFQLKLNPNYNLDPYTKTASSKITLFWPEANRGYSADVEIINTKTNKVIAKKQKISLQKEESKSIFALKFNENDIDRRVLSLKVRINLYRLTDKSYTTGHLFWKKNHSYNENVLVASHCETVTQLYRPQ